jgi:hypothetical protein
MKSDVGCPVEIIVDHRVSNKVPKITNYKRLQMEAERCTLDINCLQSKEKKYLEIYLINCVLKLN